MILETDLGEKLANLNVHAIANGKDASLLAEMLEPLTNAIAAYYSLTGVERAIRGCILALTHGQIRAGIEYEDGPGKEQEVKNAPLGYFDVTELFNVGLDILNTSESQYTNSIKLVQTMDLDGVTVLEEYYESPLVDAWITEFNNEIAEETGLISKLGVIAKYANGANLADPLKFLTEPSKMTKVPDLGEICKDIYWNRKYLTVIDALGLGIYVPTICRAGR